MAGPGCCSPTVRADPAGGRCGILAQPSLARSTRRSDQQTRTRLVADLGGDQALATLTVEAVTAADLDRHSEPADRTKAIPLAELERLWRRDDLGVREKALRRFLYQTAAVVASAGTRANRTAPKVP
jgi:hypothetical protein